jgi:hypothetical protein
MNICNALAKIIKGNVTVNIEAQRKTTANSTFKKLAVQLLNEALWFVSCSVVVGCLVLRNRQPL